MAATAVLFCLILRWCLARENSKMDAEEAESVEDIQSSRKRIRYVL